MLTSPALPGSQSLTTDASHADMDADFLLLSFLPVLYVFVHVCVLEKQGGRTREGECACKRQQERVKERQREFSTLSMARVRAVIKHRCPR